MFFIFQYQYSIIGPELRQAILLQELIKEESCIFYDVKKGKEEYFLVEDKRTRAKRAEDFEEAVTGAQNLLFPIPFCKGNRITKAICRSHWQRLCGKG